jgi:hypothetical protein
LKTNPPGHSFENNPERLMRQAGSRSDRDERDEHEL